MALRYATQTPMHDPVPLLSWMAAATARIGLATTFSVSQQHPFYVARLFATLDHLTRGRVGWNIVTFANRHETIRVPPSRQITTRATSAPKSLSTSATGCGRAGTTMRW